MTILLAQTAADSLAFGILTPKLLVDLDRRTDCCIVAEWTAFETLHISGFQFGLLLEALKGIKGFSFESSLFFSAAEGCLTATVV